jgi:hypothetical protein
MENKYLDMIPDEYLIYMAQEHWDKLEQFCILLTLDIQKDKEGLKN